MTVDSHAVLGLKRTASANEIKAAYRRLALRYHPDVREGHEEKFRIVTEAYEKLSNKQKNPYNHDHHGTHYTSSTGGGGGDAAGRSSATGGGTRMWQHGVRPQPRLSSRTSTLWGLGLFLGCIVFGGTILIGRTQMHKKNVFLQRRARLPEPTADSGKREKIANLLLEMSSEEK